MAGNQGLHPSVERLRSLVRKLDSISTQSQELMKSSDPAAVTKGLIAVGLAKQAKEEINAACQNMGFGLDVLVKITKADDESAAKVGPQLEQAFDGIVKLISKKFGADSQAVSDSLRTFVEEVIVIADYTIGRAQAHITEITGETPEVQE